MKCDIEADQLRNEGNLFYGQGNFYEASISYNKSLCYSISQLQLSLAYANRSAVYLELKQFDKCLVNIQLARDNNYPYKSKLRDRKAKCVDIQRQSCTTDPENDPLEFFKMTHPPNEKIPFVADCLELRKDEKFGRHIVTNRDLKPGDIVAVEKPIFMVSLKSASYSRCTNCLKSNMMNLIPCDQFCTSAMFCDQKCFYDARYRFHGGICQEIENLFKQKQLCNEDFTSISVSIWRGVLESFQAVQRIELIKKLMNVTPVTIFDFDYRTDDAPAASLRDLMIVNSLTMKSDVCRELIFFCISSNFVKHCRVFNHLPSDHKTILINYSARLAQIRDRNCCAFAMGDQLDGSSMQPFGTLLSHSCDPNVLPISVDNKFAYVIMKPIQKGQQLFSNYGPSCLDESTREERRTKLLTDYEFECTCTACERDYQISSLPKRDPRFKMPGAMPETFSEMVTEFKKCCAYIEQHFNNIPSHELFMMDYRCLTLLEAMAVKAVWPF